MHFTLPGDETPKASHSQPIQPQRVPISTGLGAAANRPPSLLSRGRSFTSDDLLADDADTDANTHTHTNAETTKGDGINTDSDMGDDSDHSSSLMSAGLQKSVSSSISNITNSPPSSLSSQSIAEDIEVDLDHDNEPYTPLHQTSFSSSIHEAATTQAQSATPKAHIQVQVESSTPIAQDNASDPPSQVETATSPRGDESSPAHQHARKGFHDRTLDGPEQSTTGQTKRQKVTTPSHPSHGRGQSTSSSTGTGTSASQNDVFGPTL